MKVIAKHHGPESCVGGCESAREALTTGGSAGQPLSSEITLPGCRPRACDREGNTMGDVTSEPPTGPAESKTLSMRGHSMFENRETSEVSVDGCAAGRSGKACGRNPDMHVSEESDTGNPGTYVKIELLKGGVLNSTIAATVAKGTNGAGTYSWTVPTTLAPGSDYTIKITSTTTAAYTDTSNNYFTINPQLPR